MSFSIFLNFCERGAPCATPLSDVEAAFKGAIVSRESTEHGFFWRLEYPFLNPPVEQINGLEYTTLINDCAEVYINLRAGSESLLATDGFMVSGPAAHLDFYASLLALLQNTHSALFWPGENSLVIGQIGSIAHLEEGMVETLGEPYLATEPQQIIDRIKAS